MFLDYEGPVGEMDDQANMVHGEAYFHSLINQTRDAVNAMEDTETEGTDCSPFSFRSCW